MVVAIISVACWELEVGQTVVAIGVIFAVKRPLLVVLGGRMLVSLRLWCECP